MNKKLILFMICSGLMQIASIYSSDTGATTEVELGLPSGYQFKTPPRPAKPVLTLEERIAQEEQRRAELNYQASLSSRFLPRGDQPGFPFSEADFDQDPAERAREARRQVVAAFDRYHRCNPEANTAN